MPERDAESLLQEHDEMSKDTRRWRHIYRDAYRYTQVSRDTVDRPQSGERRSDVIFDSTGGRSLEKLANRLQDLLFPAGKNFVELRPGPAFNEQSEEVRKDVATALQAINEKFHAAIWRSNFMIAIAEYLPDLAIGMGAMLLNEGPDWDPFHFTTVPQFQLNVGEGAWGTVSSVSRETKLHPQVAQQTWPNTTIEVSEADKRSQGEGNKRDYVEITYPDEDTVQEVGTFGAKPTRWFYAVLDKTERRHILVNQMPIETASPWIISRWAKAANEIRGRGPVLLAMPDIRTANKVVELSLKNASIAVSGLWTVRDDGVFNPNTSSFRAGSAIVVADNPGSQRGPTIAPLQFPGNFDISQLLLTDLRSSIRQALFDADLPPVAGPVRSATEFIERLRELFVDIGPAGGRVQKELMEPLVLRGLHILRRKGIIDIPPGLQIDSQNIAIQVVSPISQRQALDNLEKLMRALELSAFLGVELVQLGYVVEDIPQYIAKELGVVEQLIREPEDKERLRQIVGQLIAQAQQQGQPNAA